MFARYVSYDTVHLATFNYHKPSFNIEKDNRLFTVYHTKYPVQPEPNLVVIEANNNPEELYFRAFTGKHSGEYETEEDAEPYFEEVRRSISPEFRVQGIDLEKRILETVDQIKKGKFTD